MNSVHPTTSSILPPLASWTPAAIGGTAIIITGALVTAYFLKSVFTADSKKPSNISDQSRPVVPIAAESKWAYLNPLTLIATAISKIFSLMMSPYYLLFGEKEYWMNQISSPIHYNAFNGGSLTNIAQKARKNMKGLLEMMGAKGFTKSLANGSLPSWSGIDALSLPKDKQFSCGSFYLTGEEIKKQASSLRVSYDPSILSARQLSNILGSGSNSPKDEAIARGRMVSSLVAST
nr:hypothetical protein [Chlamydiota bacterium]